MEKVCIVVLNYLNYKDTFECVNTIFNDLYDNKEIVIVDNGSNNESFRVLTDRFKQNGNVHVIETGENLGFARGNNFGITYARCNLNSKFILLVNNDVKFIKSDFITKIMNSYEKGIGVIGPRIITANGLEQNPIRYKLSYNNIKKSLNTDENFLKMPKEIISLRNKLDFLILFFKNIVKKCINFKDKNYYNVDKCSEYLILHGACMMLTKDYFDFYEGLYNKTFLYYEEIILSLITQKVHLKKKYVHDAVIFHKEDQSSIMSFKNKNSIKTQHEINSIKECLNIFDKDYNYVKTYTK